MEKNNPLYRNQGIHVISNIFTVVNGEVKVLLVKRRNEPFKNKWALVSGALYNNENLEDGLKREMYEKTGIKDIPLTLCNVFGDVNRSSVMRMIGISYLGVIDSNRIKYLKSTNKTVDCDWFNITDIPDLAYDHNKIIKDALDNLKKFIINTSILKSLFPDGFTLPEIQKVYETIIGSTIDRRNFRRKLLNSSLVIDTNKYVNFVGNKPCKLYKFK